MQSKYLLDTSTFLWIILGSSKIADSTRKLFIDPANEIYLSAVSVSEIAIKISLKKLNIPQPVSRFVVDQREKHGIQSLAFDERSALQLSRLPHLHRDPFDRMLICQALIDGLTILTPDEQISQYGVPTFW